MGISNFAIKDLSSDSITFSWDTDIPASSELDFGLVSNGTWSVARLAAQGGDTTSHSYTVRNLQPNKDYRAQAQSYDSQQNFSYLPCDDFSSPKDFTTPAAAGPATDLSVTANPAEINKGQVSQLSITATTNGQPASGRTVHFNIHNGADRGTFSPDPAMTGSDGKVTVAFTALKNGKAQIQVLVDTLSEEVDVKVN